jgi:5-(hydroxymethyl)furfural/furfural oxidase
MEAIAETRWQDFDYVIVGGGSAGCVMANRLSADPTVRVVLFEAGEDTPPGQEPGPILDSYPMPIFHGDRWIWPNLTVQPTTGAGSRLYEQGRVMGGGSSINVQAANRGLPRDYNEWADDGAEGWAWKDVLPYFEKLERDLDFPDLPGHGNHGPIPIRRIPLRDWPPFCVAFADGMRKVGLHKIEDQNTQFGDGFFPAAFSNENDRRVSTATAYLDLTTRGRRNLRIVPSARVDHIVMKGRCAAGVVVILSGQGKVEVLANKETIICAGALQTPALLMRAGIGDLRELHALGIPGVVHLAGVGRNLQDHPSLTFAHYLTPRWRAPLEQRRASMLAARFSSGAKGCEISDMYIASSTRAAWHSLGKRLGLFFLWCNRPYSRGRVSLTSANSDALPAVSLNLLDDNRDLQRLVSGVRFCRKSYRLHVSAAIPATFFRRLSHRAYAS